MDGVILISHDHFLALKIASVNPVALRKASANMIHSLYSITLARNLSDIVAGAVGCIGRDFTDDA